MRYDILEIFAEHAEISRASFRADMADMFSPWIPRAPELFNPEDIADPKRLSDIVTQLRDRADEVSRDTDRYLSRARRPERLHRRTISRRSIPAIKPERPDTVCKTCGAILKPSKTGPPRKYCDDRCRDRDRKGCAVIDRAAATQCLGPECTIVVTQPSRGIQREYCSNRCQKRAARARAIR